MEAITREEQFMAAAAGQAVELPEPITRREKFLKAIADAAQSGGVSDEVIQSAVNKYLEENPVEAVGGVQTVNGIAPDENGNVAVAAGGVAYSGLEILVDHEVTAEEATAANITFTQAAYPKINSQKLLLLFVSKPASVSTPWWGVKAGTIEVANPGGQVWDYARIVCDAANGVWTQNVKLGANYNNADLLAPSYFFSTDSFKNKPFADYTSITLASYQAFLEEGTKIKIWGGAV